MNTISRFFSNTMQLFYPHICCGCGSDVLKKTEQICLRCKLNLPHTHFEKFENNPVERIFIGRAKIEAAHSEFYFAKHKIIQLLLHELKYKGNQAIGEYLGEMMGNNLMASKRFEADILIPLPLFAKKEFTRGYNQATVICRGMAKAMQIPVIINNVVRERATETQTKKHRTERWQNVAESFTIKNPDALKGKHVLLVDDVITTGATLDACCQTLATVAGKISIATLAFATK